MTSEKAYAVENRLNALVASGGLGGGILRAVKPGGGPGTPTFTSRASTTAVTIDPDLQMNVDAGATYLLAAHIIYSGGASGSTLFQFTLSGPAGTEIDWYVPSYWNSSNARVDNETSATAASKIAYTYGTAAASQSAVSLHGVAYIGASAGSFGFFWGPGISSATTTRVWSGSYLSLTQV